MAMQLHEALKSKPRTRVQFLDVETERSVSTTVYDATPEQLKKLLEVAIENHIKGEPAPERDGASNTNT